MPSPSSPDVPPLPVGRSIARSRSRYKGPRPHGTLASTEPPSLSAERLPRLRNSALDSREPKPRDDRKDGKRLEIQPPPHEPTQRHRGSVNHAPTTSEAFAAQRRGNLGQSNTRTTAPEDLISWSEAAQGYQQGNSCRKYGAEAEPHKEASQDTTRSQSGATSREPYSRRPGADLTSFPNEQTSPTVRSAALSKRGLTQRIAGQSNEKRLRKSREELKRTISAPIAIEPSQDTAKPAFDAPVSAINAGERRVRVKYDRKLMLLPVTLSTTPLDIIRSAADQLSESIDPNSTVLLESFKQLGLERPLRRYERVRDVLNSWDNDTQNALVLKPSSAGDRDDMLDLNSVSSSQPVDTSVRIHHSQRPGHWDKRWVTLRSDGQMLIAKREGGETANICHISDFDIYVPTARQSAKRIRPPRKICFAIKSQQKSSMFLSTANFVHFFSTSDKTLAASWYKAVQEWRSWYLVNVMGEGGESAQGSEKVSTKADIKEISDAGFPKQWSQRRPPEPPPQGMTAMKVSTLADHNKEHPLPFRNANSRHKVAKDTLDDRPFHTRGEVQAPQPRKITKDADLSAMRGHGPSFVQAVRHEEPQPFAATGLLGRKYTQRQKAQREREKAQNASPAEPVAKPDIDPVRSLNLTLSQRPKPKPLVDLTPQYQEPPQHVKKGRGVVLEQIPAGGLVEVANTPEAAIFIPPATTWRRPTSKGGDGRSVSRHETVRRDHSSGAPSEPRQTSTSPEKGGVAFTGGLLANNSRGQGGARTGRGVMTGDREAKEPMLEVGEAPHYAPGSLLDRVERQDGGSHPIIEREKKREIVAAVGEGT